MFNDFLKKFKFRMSFSGDGEDVLLYSFLESYEQTQPGFYVDIGAYHPYQYSNTYFYYRRGWRGINVEPTPGRIEKFRKHRKKDTNLQYAIGRQPGKSKFYCFDEPALNSFDEELSKKRDATTPYKIKEVIEIPMLPLGSILDEHLPAGQKITFFDIDTEGFDYEVLCSNNWDKYRPQFILVEGELDVEDTGGSRIYVYLRQQGYKLIAKTLRTLVFEAEP